jgi:nicotinamide mononucleotide transporter
MRLLIGDTVRVLSDLVAPLNQVIFVFGADHVTWAELLGFVTGIWCVWLTVKVRISNFPVGIANDLFFLVLFLAAGFYADAGLQVVFAILGFIGWWQWLHGGQNHSRLTVRTTSFGELGIILVAVAVFTTGLTVLLTHAHDVAPFLDALTTSLSLAAQWLLNTKRIQNWYFWIAADLIYIPLYVYKHLWLTSIVYVAFLTMCFAGIQVWRHARDSTKVVALTNVAGAG